MGKGKKKFSKLTPESERGESSQQSSGAQIPRPQTESQVQQLSGPSSSTSTSAAPVQGREHQRSNRGQHQQHERRENPRSDRGQGWGQDDRRPQQQQQERRENPRSDRGQGRKQDYRQQPAKLTPTGSQSSIQTQGEHEKHQQRPVHQAGGDQNQPKKPSYSNQPQAAKPTTSSLQKPFTQMQVSDMKFPTRPPVKFSCTNKAIKLQSNQIATNYFVLTIDKNKFPDQVIHYHVTFTPDRPKKMLRQAFTNFLSTHFAGHVGRVGFDGQANVYCDGRFPFPQEKEGEEFEVVVHPHPNDGGTDRTFKITYQTAIVIDVAGIKNYNAEFNVPPQYAIQAFDVILRTVFDKPELLRYKQSVVYFPPQTPRERIQLVDGYEMYIGLFQSCIFASRILLNIDVSHKAFPSAGSLYDVMKSVENRLQNERFRNRQVPLEAIKFEMNDLLRGVDLIYKAPDRRCLRRKFNEILRGSDQEMFVNDTDGRRISVAEYFGRALQNPREWCVHIGIPRVVNGVEKRMLIPMQFLEVPPGQALNRQAPDSCKTPMIREAATSTNRRKQKIIEKVALINYNESETIKNFGITVGQDFIKIDSHILPAPALQYARNSVTPANGEWKADRERFTNPAGCTKWGILVTVPPRMDEIEDFAINFARIAVQKGLNFSEFNRSNVLQYTERRVIKPEIEKIMKQFKSNQVQIVFVIMQNDAQIYPDIKKTAELSCGLLTQCLRWKTVTKRNYNGELDTSTLNNILLKVNTKLNGINHKIDPNNHVPSINKKRFMVLGADVTHPSPEQRTIPSVVGVAASYDTEGYRYKCQWRIQDARAEVIQNFEEIMRNQLEFYKQKNQNQYPEHILYYRDGVDDGRVDELNRTEIQGIKNAISNIKPVPLLTVIIVQKRHHTRLFPCREEIIDKNPRNPKKPKKDWNNVPPGTVVDHEIIDPTKWQFFMVSHVSLQGVAKPTKYWIAYDDSGVSNEDLQLFTYNLCHLFARCNRTVNYVAPTYYAHHVAARGRVYIHRENINFANLQRENEIRRVRPEIINDCPMFFV